MEQLQAILDKVTKIESYLYHDTATNRPGIVQRQEDVEERLEKLEEEAKVKKAVFSLVGIIGGFLGMVLVELIKWLLTFHK